MSQRLLDTTKWMWCILATMWGPAWSPVSSVTVRTPPSVLGTVGAQAKYFQDFFSVQLSPYKIEFGHVCEDPNTWEQRYEKKDFKNHRDMGKVRWGDKKGGYGEHYWDLNHAGHADNHGHNDEDDDGSYHEDPYTGEYKVHDSDPYDEPSEPNPSYNSGYDAGKLANYDESNRAKRAQPKIRGDAVEEVKTLNKLKAKEEEHEQTTTKRPAKVRRHKPRQINQEEANQRQERKERNEEKAIQRQERSETNEEEAIQRQERRETIENESIQRQERRDANQEEAIISQNTPRARPQHFVPYEGGAGVRTHQHPEITPVASVPRLFLEPSTGHVIDRATGQAYILQPIVANFN